MTPWKKRPLNANTPGNKRRTAGRTGRAVDRLNFDGHWKSLRGRKRKVLTVSTGDGLRPGATLVMTGAELRAELRKAFEAGQTSTRIRNRIVAMLARGWSYHRVAKESKVSFSTVLQVARRIGRKSPATVRRESNRVTKGDPLRPWVCSNCHSRIITRHCVRCLAVEGKRIEAPAEAFRTQ